MAEQGSCRTLLERYAFYSTRVFKLPFWYWQWGQFLERQPMVFAQMMQAIREANRLLVFLAAI